MHSTATIEAPVKAPPAPALSLQFVTRRYGHGQAQVTALAGVSLDVPAATWLAVMGPSGSGKSTLLHVAAGLDRVDSGQVHLAGRDITHASDAELTLMRRKQIGFVFQSFNLMSALTAGQNVALPMRLAGEQIPRGKILDVLDSVGLAGRANHRPRELSGGQQQRVAIARAIATEPDILFADEPTGALDTVAARSVLGMLRGLVDEHRQTIVMVTHDPAAAARADSVVFLADGQLVDRLDRPTTSAVAARLAALEA